MTADIRLTQYASGGGCACKIPPGELEEAVARLLPAAAPPGLLIGLEHGDDAAGVLLRDGQAVGPAGDFFTPGVHHPYTLGVIAADNALSAAYAREGEPLGAPQP